MMKYFRPWTTFFVGVGVGVFVVPKVRGMVGK
jgi:hypothetical protein